MRTVELLKKLQGIQTVQSVMTLLNVDLRRAIYYVRRLREQGYVKTRKRRDQTRVYSISFENRLRGVSYYDVINKHSPVKISAPNVYNVYGKQPTVEEALVFAVKTRSVRTILAALALFRKVENWSELYKIGKQNRIERQIGALYDLSRQIMRKVRRMPDRFRHNALPKTHYPFGYTIPGLQSNDFKNIEKVWKVYLPFNKKDLEEYYDFG
jgi:hypothetical protein